MSFIKNTKINLSGTIGKTLLIVLLLCSGFSADILAKPVAQPQNPFYTEFYKPVSSSAFLARPTYLLLSYTTAKSHFKIHYMNSGYHAVEQSYTLDPLVPDYVINTGNYLEKAYLCLKDTLGIKRPPADDPDSPEIDIYVLYLPDTYAETWLDTKQQDNSWTSYMLVNNSFDSNIFETHGEDALKVSCAHELFHVFQLGYGYRGSDRWYMEMSSVWFEERLYPNVNDYFQYVENYSTTWRRSINHSSQWYNNVGYNLYLEKRFSTEDFSIMEAIWSHMDEKTALGSIAYALDSLGVSFSATLADWGRAQILSNNLSDPDFSFPFDDADSLPTVSFDSYSDNIIGSSYLTETVNDSFITTYYTFPQLSPHYYILNIEFPVYSSASLVLSNGHNSNSRLISSGRHIIDGSHYDNIIISYGSTEANTIFSLHLENISGPEITNCYPNPVSSNQTLTLEYLCDKMDNSAMVSLYTLRGERLMHKTLSTSRLILGKNTLTLPVYDLSSGVYLIALDINGSRLVKKFTVIN